MSPKNEAHKPHPAPLAKKKHAPHEKPDGPGGKKDPGKHLRRCYEHLARVDALLASTQADARLAQLAQRTREIVNQQLKLQQSRQLATDEAAKSAAELARAAEHIAFAAIVQHNAERIAWEGPLEQAFRHEYDELIDDAGEAADRSDPKAVRDPQEDAQAEIAELTLTLTREAETASEQKNFARAIECMRAAEALSVARHHLDHLRKHIQTA